MKIASGFVIFWTKFTIGVVFIVTISCQHDPIVQSPVDTGTVCDPSKIYFENDVLPIITSNCAYSGCHNAASAKEGIILDNYNNVIKTGKIKSGNSSGSKFYQVMVDKDPKDIMPPPPANAISTPQLKTF